MASVCFGCGLSTDDDGALTVQCVHGAVDSVGAMVTDVELGDDTILFTTDELCFTNDTQCDKRLVMQTSADVRATNCPTCGNPFFRLEFSDNGGTTYQILEEEPPRVICGWGDGVTDTDFPPTMRYLIPFTVAAGEQLCLTFRLRALNWGSLCVDPPDPDDPDAEPIETPVATLALGSFNLVRVC